MSNLRQRLRKLLGLSRRKRSINHRRRRWLLAESLEQRALLAADFATITGIVFNDLDNDQIFDAGTDVGLAGVTVTLSGIDDLGAMVSASTVTESDDPLTPEDETGRYRFEGLRAGDYTIVQSDVPSGFYQASGLGTSMVTISSEQAMGIQGTVIDNFDTTMQAISASMSTVLEQADSANTVPGEAVGGQRDLYVRLDSATGSASMSANQNEPGVLDIDPSSSGIGTYIVTWDGPDNDPQNLDPTGLGGIDITDAGLSTGIAFRMGVDKANEFITIRVYTDAANWSEATKLLPFTDGSPSGELIVPFDDFVAMAGAGADFENVGALQIEINAQATAMDGQIDLVGAVGPTVLEINFANLEPQPGIDIEKSTNNEDADGPTGPFVPSGSTVAFEYVVSNTGNVPLANVSVLDDNGTPQDTSDDFQPEPVLVDGFNVGDVNRDGLLDLDEVWRYTATGTAATGQYRNDATVTAEDPLGTVVSDTDASHHFASAPAIDIEKATNGEDADAVTGPLIAAGGTVVWSYVVTNTGNVDLTNVRIVDDNGTPQDTSDDMVIAENINLGVNQSQSFTHNATAVAGQYGNVATVTGNDSLGAVVTDSDPSHYFGVAAGIDLEKSTNGIDADMPIGPVVPVSSTVTFEYVVTNTGNVPLAEVMVVDDNGTTADASDDFEPAPVLNNGFNVGDLNQDNLLDVTEVWLFRATRNATAGIYRNDATATGVDPLGMQVSDSDPSHHFGAVPAIDIEKATNGQDADTGTGPMVAAGSSITWTYVVTNTGNVDLTAVRIVDDNGTPGDTSDDVVVAENIDLAIGETRSFTLNGTAIAGQYENIASASGSDSLGTQVTDEDPSRYFGAAPNIAIEKATNGFDADTTPGPTIAIGDNVTWTYVVTNTGNVALSNVQIVDDHGSPGDSSDDFVVATGISLNVGESRTFTHSGTATAGQYGNIAVATGNDELGATVSDDDPSHYFGAAPAIDLEKSTNGQDADTATGPQIAVGDTVTWSYVVTNTGNVDLMNVRIVDDNGTPDSTTDDFVVSEAFDLAVGEMRTFTATATAVSGQYGNRARVTANDALNTVVSDEDPSHYFGAAPAIDIEKATNGQDADTATGPLIDTGDAVTWTYVVTNTGNVALSNIRILDDNGSPDDPSDDFIVAENISLAAGASRTFTNNSTAVAGQYKNVATVTGTDSLGTTVSDSDSSHYFGRNIAIDLEKSTNGQDADTGTGPVVAVGAEVTWTYVVTNTGNVPLTGVEVVDDNGTPNLAADDITIATGVSLAVGESRTFTHQATATAGQYENVAMATASDGASAMATDSDPSRHFGAVTGINIEKSTNGVDADIAEDGPQIRVGQTVTFTYTVTNTGNLALGNVTVVDDQGLAVQLVSGDTDNDGLLDPNEVWIYEATDTAARGQYVNVGTVTARPFSDETMTPLDLAEVEDSDMSHYFGYSGFSKRLFLG